MAGRGKQQGGNDFLRRGGIFTKKQTNKTHRRDIKMESGVRQVKTGLAGKEKEKRRPKRKLKKPS